MLDEMSRLLEDKSNGGIILHRTYKKLNEIPAAKRIIN